jgi:hypothetical protein
MRPSSVLGAVALAVLATMSSQFSARAADIAVPVQPAPSTYIPAIFSWTGWYLGIEAGGGFGNADWTDTFNPAVTATVSPSGFLVGGYTGINYQMGSFVIGLDIDFDGTWVNGSTTDAASNLLQTKVFWTSTASGRLGLRVHRSLDRTSRIRLSRLGEPERPVQRRHQGAHRQFGHQPPAQRGEGRIGVQVLNQTRRLASIPQVRRRLKSLA